MRRLIEYLFGCSHENITFPQGGPNSCFVSCLDCGKRLKYDWELMDIVTPTEIDWEELKSC